MLQNNSSSKDEPSLISLHSDNDELEDPIQSAFEIGDLEEDDDFDDDDHSSFASDTVVGDEEEPRFLDPPHRHDDDNDIVAPESDQIYQTTVELHELEAIIEAPCDLPAEYVLRVDLGDGRTLVTQIPFGGVEKGDCFTAMYRIHGRPAPKKKRRRDLFHRQEEQAVFGWRPATSHWKSSLFSCFEFGPCHPSCLGACCCHCILLSQVMNRMNLNWYGRRQSSQPLSRRWSLARDTFTLLVLIFTAYYTILVLLDAISIKALNDELKQEEKAKHHHQQGDSVLYNVVAIRIGVALVFSLFFVWLLARTRRAVRDHYRIPPSATSDCCVSCCCPVCVLSQLARQTADYHRQTATWCTDTGVCDDARYGNVSREEEEENMATPDIEEMFRDEDDDAEIEIV